MRWFNRRRLRPLPVQFREAPMEAYEFHHPAFGEAPPMRTTAPMFERGWGRDSANRAAMYRALMNAKAERERFSPTLVEEQLLRGAHGPAPQMPPLRPRLPQRSEHGHVGVPSSAGSETPWQLAIIMQRVKSR